GRVRPEVVAKEVAATALEHLAEVGFSQSYTYFTWRNTAWELRTYLRSLLESGRRDFLRYNFWPNTPDILPEYLQVGGEPAHRIRLILAATLAANYGIYGAPFERFEATPLKAGGEEYRDSEKYELRHWPEAEARPIHDLMARLNRIRRENPPLQFDHTLLFHESDNDQLLCYSKHLGEDVLIVVVNLDFHHRQSGFISLDLDALGLELGGRFQAHDLLGGARYLWRGNRQFLELDPHGLPAHILRVRRHVRTEADFEYYL
ncbi:MAG: alpha-1,4-glucan--maltose-1-phosphate maltosyltransferase, partial [Planctomycetota bacterium]